MAHRKKTRSHNPGRRRRDTGFIHGQSQLDELERKPKPRKKGARKSHVFLGWPR